MSVYHIDGTGVSVDNWISDSVISNFGYVENAESDTYVAKVELDSWGQGAVHDYTFRIYSAQTYNITVMERDEIHDFLSTMQTTALDSGFDATINQRQSSFTYANANSGTFGDVSYFELASILDYSSTCSHLTFKITLSGVEQANFPII